MERAGAKEAPADSERGELDAGSFLAEIVGMVIGLWRDNKFLAAKRIALTRSLATELLDKGRVHLDEIYSQRMDKYYPGDLILHDNGERVTYYLSFRGGKK